MSQPVISTAGSASLATAVEIPFTPSCDGLLELFLAVSDGRSDQGRDHPVAVVLALVGAATVAGSKGYTAMSGWVADVPTDILDGLYARVEARPAGRLSRSTLWRVCTDTDGDVLDAVIAEWTTTQRTGTLDGAATSADTPIPDGTSLALQTRLPGAVVMTVLVVVAARWAVRRLRTRPAPAGAAPVG